MWSSVWACSYERVGHRGVAVAERGHREPGEEVEVSLASVVPKVRALAADEHHRAGAYVGINGELMAGPPGGPSCRSLRR